MHMLPDTSTSNTVFPFSFSRPATQREHRLLQRLFPLRRMTCRGNEAERQHPIRLHRRNASTHEILAHCRRPSCCEGCAAAPARRACARRAIAPTLPACPRRPTERTSHVSGVTSSPRSDASTARPAPHREAWRATGTAHRAAARRPARSYFASAYSSNLANAAASPFFTCADSGVRPSAQ